MPRKKPVGQRRRNRPVCFVLMPFERAKPRGRASKYKSLGRVELDTVFALLKRCLKDEGFLVKRSEGVGDILREVVLQLDQAELVCADLTGLNPNVMYELGIRHAFTKKTIILTQDIEELPFDLRSYHAIEYGWITDVGQRKLKQDIRGTLRRIREQPDTKFGPVHSHLGAKRLAIREEEKRGTLRKLTGLGGELNHMWSSVVKVLRVLTRRYPGAVKEGKVGWEIDLGKLDLQATSREWKAAREEWSMTYPSIDLFLATRYVGDEFDEYGDIHAFTRMLGSLRLNMNSLSRSLGDFLSIQNLLSALVDDVVVIMEAVGDDRYGENLSLSCTRKLSSWDKHLGKDKEGRAERVQVRNARTKKI